MDLFRNGTDKTGTGQVPFTRQILSEPFVFLSEPFQFFRSCIRPFKTTLSEGLLFPLEFILTALEYYFDLICGVGIISLP